MSSSPSPPDRSHLLTEQRNPRSQSLHTLSVAACVELMQEEDRAVLTALESARRDLTALIEAAEPGFVAGGRLIYIGAGTSGRLGVLDASECPPTFCTPPERVVGLIAGGDSALRRSSEGKEDDPNGALPELQALALGERDTVIGIAAGGTTPYVLGALRIAKELCERCTTGLIACSPLPQRPPFTDCLVTIPTGAEVITGSTRMKAGTATKMVLNTISTTLMVRSGRIYQNLMVDLRATNAKLRDRAARIIGTLTGLSREASLELLDRADGSVKIAVVMEARKATRQHAEELLTQHRGRLDVILDRRFGERTPKAE